MKKVVWLVNEYSGPGDTWVRETVLARLLEKYGYEVYVLCGSADSKFGSNKIADGNDFVVRESDGAKFIIIKTNDYRNNYQRVFVSLQFQWRIWRLRNQLPRPDIIVSTLAGLFGNVFLRWKNRYDTIVIYDIPDLWPEEFVGMGYIRENSLVAKFLYSLEHKAYRDADGIIFSFQGGKDYIIGKGWSKSVGGDVDTDDIGYLNNGVDLEIVDRERNDYVLDDADLDSNKFKAVYLGSVSAFNGLDIIVEAAKELQHRCIDDIVILVYGYGNQEERLKKAVESYGLRNIKFKGRLDKRYAMNVLSRGDLNLFTFRNLDLIKYGVSPNKLFMYFASGKPVLSMIKPGYDLVENEHCGCSVENDPVAVADAMVRFSKMSKEEYDGYCRNSRRVGELYDYKNLVKVLLHQIEKGFEKRRNL